MLRNLFNIFILFLGMQLERRFFGSLVVNEQTEKRRVALQVPPECKLE